MLILGLIGSGGAEGDPGQLAVDEGDFVELAADEEDGRGIGEAALASPARQLDEEVAVATARARDRRRGTVNLRI